MVGDLNRKSVCEDTTRENGTRAGVAVLVSGNCWIETSEELVPTFKWTISDELKVRIDDKEIKEFNLYVSVFPPGEGLLPSDRFISKEEIGKFAGRFGLTKAQVIALIARKSDGNPCTDLDDAEQECDLHFNRILTESFKFAEGKPAAGAFAVPTSCLGDNR